MQRNNPVFDLTTRSFVVRAESADDATRSVLAVISTDAPTLVFDWSRGEIIEESLLPSGMVAPDQVPLLDCHNRYSINDQFGCVRGFDTSDFDVKARMFFDKDPESDKAWGKVSGGSLRDVSVGYRTLDFVDIPAGQSRTIAGKAYTAGKNGLRVTTQWQLKEVSLTPIGADQYAKIRAERGEHPSRANSHGGSIMKNWLLRMLMKLGLRADASDEQARAFFAGLSDEHRAAVSQSVGLAANADAESVIGALNAMPDERREAVIAEFGNTRAVPNIPSIPPVPAKTENADSIRAEAFRIERERITSIRAAAGSDIDAETIERAIADGITVEQAKARFLDKLRDSRAPASPGSPAIHVKNQEDAMRNDVIAASFVIRSGIDPVKAYSALTPKASEGTRKQQLELIERGDAVQLREMGLLDLCKRAILNDGGTIPSTREEIIQQALFGNKRSMSGGSLSNIFTTSVNAVLVGAYSEVEDTTTSFTSDGTANDFKQQEFISMGKTSTLEKLPRGDEATHAKISDSKASIRLARYAKQFSLDEQDIIDDNMNALSIIPVEMGQAAARLRPNMVYSLLRSNPTMPDGYALFSAEHGNLIDLAFGSSALEAAMYAMTTQTMDGVNINLSPEKIIASAKLKISIMQLLNSTQLVIAGNTDRTMGNYNPMAYMGLAPVFDPRLDNGVLDPNTGIQHGGSTTSWYLSAKPSGNRGIMVCYLNGNKTPSVRSYVFDRGRYGIGFDIKHDIGAAAIDWRPYVRGNS
ncbi:TPA: hypothetical protein DDW35_01070 [Candidatus Sumerlaeota bacterium]|nr:hypothetical protein [Candidatus Sumerlaeota bacterium]